VKVSERLKSAVTGDTKPLPSSKLARQCEAETNASLLEQRERIVQVSDGRVADSAAKGETAMIEEEKEEVEGTRGARETVGAGDASIRMERRSGEQNSCEVASGVQRVKFWVPLEKNQERTEKERDNSEKMIPRTGSTRKGRPGVVDKSIGAYERKQMDVDMRTM